MSESWRDVVSIHPAADLFPMMTADELKALGEDIRKNGQGVPIILWEAEKGAPLLLLDGRNRLDAMEAAGLPVLNQDGRWLDCGVRCDRARGGDPYEYVLSFNIHRRHLTAEQRRDLIARVLKATPGKSNRQIAGQVKADDKTVGKVRRELEATAEIPQLEATTGKDGKARKQPIKKKRHDVDDYLADKRAKKMTETTAVRQPIVDDDETDAAHEEGLRVIAARGFLNRAAEAKEIATIGKLRASDVTEAMTKAADDAAAAWTTAARKLRDMKPAPMPASSIDTMPAVQGNPADATEVAALANALRVGLAGLDPVVDRIAQVGADVFWRQAGDNVRRQVESTAEFLQTLTATAQDDVMPDIPACLDRRPKAPLASADKAKAEAV
jgi:hypothetical protein